MTKRDLVCRVSDDTGMVQTDVQAVVQQMFDELAGAMSRAETVELRNFGVFKVKLSKRRTGRNPKVPYIEIEVPPRAVVKFSAGKALERNVAKLVGMLEGEPEVPQSDFNKPQEG